MSEFLSFDAFITPHIIRIAFALGFLLIALGALFRVFTGCGRSESSGRHPAVGRACIVALL